MPRKPPPLSSFGPELQTALRAGAQNETKITFESERVATRFAYRVNLLRSAMRHYGHPDADHLYRCGVYREGKVVTLKPRDSEFGSALKDVHAPAPVGVPKGAEPSALDGFFSDLENNPTEGENNG